MVEDVWKAHSPLSYERVHLCTPAGASEALCGVRVVRAWSEPSESVTCSACIKKALRLTSDLLRHLTGVTYPSVDHRHSLEKH